ncbi:C40 family peptidase [Paenibacillus aestuarii]|uniref:C40 family peptidase n=1 Tax=Paenibacillus aestuarii TaxID=516965 RepID=A0ABW0KC93_9BACL|nr:C40 family peptidase [Paenibacillus aestuarii]
MHVMKKSRLGKSLVGISLSLSLLTSGSLLLYAPSAQASTITADATATYSATSISTSKADKIISTAKSYIGKVKYAYGVRDVSRLRLDCSAFTQLVFQKNGISIPWGSKAQAKVGNYVSKSNLRKGDLVMFSVGTPGRIDHVGIYVGNGKFISNTTSSGVVINEMNSGYWKNRYITARRL